MDEFLTVAEVAEILRVNPQTIRNWIDAGALRRSALGSGGCGSAARTCKRCSTEGKDPVGLPSPRSTLTGFGKASRYPGRRSRESA